MNTTHTTKQGHTAKQGKYGTLYLHRIEYKDPIDPCFPVSVDYMYAYSIEHVYDSWGERAADQGFDFEIISVKRTKKS